MIGQHGCGGRHDEGSPMTDVLQESRLLIGGTLREVTGGKTFENVNPATEEVIGVAADATAADMDAAIGAARTAFDTTDWSTNVELRVRCIRQLQEAVQKHADELRHMLVAEVGAAFSSTYGAQLDGPMGGIGWIADMLEGYAFEEDLGIGEPFGMPTKRYLRREAVGVVGAITPWNYPIQINVAKAIPALAAGNTVVLKGAPDTPWSATVLGRFVAEHTDIPAGVFNVIVSSDHAIGAQLSEDKRVDLVTFTGSTATGRKVMSACSATIKKVFLELGGKSAQICLDDADMAAAAAGVAFQITSHAGQGCAVTSRWVVPEKRLDEAIDAVNGMIANIPYGDPSDPANMYGPLISAKQRERVLGYIQKGQDEGAKVAVGGGIPEKHPKGWFVEPTVLVNVDQNATVAQEEIFGPVLVVLTHKGDDDAVAIANNSIFGLSGAVVSGDIEHARAVGNRIRTGTMSLNGGIYYGPDVPFGGYKQSGIGRESGQLGFEEYLEVKAIAEPA